MHACMHACRHRYTHALLRSDLQTVAEVPTVLLPTCLASRSFCRTQDLRLAGCILCMSGCSETHSRHTRGHRYQVLAAGADADILHVGSSRLCPPRQSRACFPWVLGVWNADVGNSPPDAPDENGSQDETLRSPPSSPLGQTTAYTPSRLHTYTPSRPNTYTPTHLLCTHDTPTQLHNYTPAHLYTHTRRTLARPARNLLSRCTSGVVCAGLVRL